MSSNDSYGSAVNSSASFQRSISMDYLPEQLPHSPAGCSIISKSDDDDDDKDDYNDNDNDVDDDDDDGVCWECAKPIRDEHLLKVRGFDRPWHARCLRCCVCRMALDSETSCFLRSNNIYCRKDYICQQSVAVKCSKCYRQLCPSDWIRKARDHLYHLACFACDACKRQLSTGEEFALHDDRLLCKTHYVETATGTTDNDGEDGGGVSGSQKQKTKRVRTSFTEEQLRVLHANFRIDSNPDGQDLERIAQQTGLSKRVTQVWFQNSRARQKKHQMTSSSSSSAAAAAAAASSAAAAAAVNNNNNNRHVINNNNRLSPSSTLQLSANPHHQHQHQHHHHHGGLSSLMTSMNSSCMNTPSSSITSSSSFSCSSAAAAAVGSSNAGMQMRCCPTSTATGDCCSRMQSVDDGGGGGGRYTASAAAAALASSNGGDVNLSLLRSRQAYQFTAHLLNIGLSAIKTEQEEHDNRKRGIRTPETCYDACALAAAAEFSGYPTDAEQSE